MPLGAEAEGAGRPGKGLLELASPLAVPQLALWLTELREDCAVELFSFRTRLVLGALALGFEEAEGREEVVAQLRGMELLVLPVTGRDG